MPKDYKDAPAARSDSRLSHPLLLGMIIGLLLGVVISLARALSFNGLGNAFHIAAINAGRHVNPMFAGATVLMRAVSHDWRGYLTTVLTAVIVLRLTCNPLWLLAAGAVLGIAGVF